MFTNFQEIESFFNSRKSLGIKPGLDRIKKLLQLLDNPQDRIQAIHIAGTNGKGSTVHFIKDALQANGYHVGIFTSPSFSGLTGHMFIDNSAIPETKFVKLCNEIYPFIVQLDNENKSPTEFEIITALAFVYFSAHVDIVLVEAGMGGREDTTNCFQPLISIITNVARDHTAFLGNSLAEIAYHKAGIIKNGAPVIIGDMDQEAIDVIDTEIRLKQTKGLRLGKDFTYKNVANNWDFLWSYSSDLALEMTLQMRGEHQKKNASIACMALVELENFGYSINFDKVKEAMKNTQVPGRFEVIQQTPKVILDGAHNPAGIQSFVDTVHSNFAGKEKHLLFAAFKDKDLKTMLNQLNGNFSTITLSSFDHPRAANAKELYNLTRKNGKFLVKDWRKVLDTIPQQTEACYFITGSLHFISGVRDYMLRDRQE